MRIVSKFMLFIYNCSLLQCPSEHESDMECSICSCLVVGHILFKNNLGCCYAHGIAVEKDEKRAVQLYSEAAAQGSTIDLCETRLC